MFATRSTLKSAGDRRNPRATAIVTGMLLAFTSVSVFAHHPLGGATPTTFMQGLLSGVGHPVIGFDHLAFVIAAGILAASLGRSVSLLITFICASALSVYATSAGLALPGVEIVVLGSLAVIGVALIASKVYPALAVSALFAFAGVAHGAAYGNAVVGAEATPLVAYLIGIVVIQSLIAVAAIKSISAFGAFSQSNALAPRLAGAVVFGVALTLAVEQIESAIFTG